MSDVEEELQVDDDVSDVLDDISLNESSSYKSSDDSEHSDSSENTENDDKVSITDAEPELEPEPETEIEPIQFEIKEEVTEKYKPYKYCVYIDNDKRITSDYISSYEYASVIGYLAELMSKTGVINIDHKGEYDSIKIAEMVFKERKTGLIIKRFVGINKKGLSEYELWKVDELKY